MCDQLLENVDELFLRKAEYFAQVLELDDASDHSGSGKRFHRSRPECVHASENRFTDCRRQPRTRECGSSIGSWLEYSAFSEHRDKLFDEKRISFCPSPDLRGKRCVGLGSEHAAEHFGCLISPER